MMVDLIGAGLLGEDETMPLGTGRTRQEDDGTWVAFVSIDSGGLGLFGAGYTEQHALNALEAKLKALGNICQAGYAEAESRLKVRKLAEVKAKEDELMELLKSAMGGGGRRASVEEILNGPAKKKPEGGEGGN